MNRSEIEYQHFTFSLWEKYVKIYENEVAEEMYWGRWYTTYRILIHRSLSPKLYLLITILICCSIVSFPIWIMTPWDWSTMSDGEILTMFCIQIALTVFTFGFGWLDAYWKMVNIETIKRYPHLSSYRADDEYSMLDYQNHLRASGYKNVRIIKHWTFE